MSKEEYMVTGDRIEKRTKAPYIRRSRLEMKASILKAVVSGPVVPTRLISLTNSSHPTLKKYLPDLERRGLIKIEQVNRGRTGRPYRRLIQPQRHRITTVGRPYRSLIHITAKGKKVLTEYESVANKLMN